MLVHDSIDIGIYLIISVIIYDVVGPIFCTSQKYQITLIIVPLHAE